MERLLTVKEVQDILQVKRDLAYRLVNSEGFPTIKIGRNIRVPETEFDKWVRKYTYTKFEI